MVRHIDEAKRSIFVQAYSFTSKPIGNALIRAKSRRVNVEVLLDRSNTDERSELSVLEEAGIAVLIDSKHPIAHNKVMIFDDHVVLTGSYNFTKQAESNGENCLFVSSVELTGQYQAQWRDHQAHSFSQESSERASVPHRKP